MATQIRVLIVEDSEDDADLVLLELRRGGYAPVYERVDTQAAMVAALAGGKWDLILSDFALPGFSGLGALAVWKEFDLDIPFIVISGTIGEETAVMMMKGGASDYLMKDHLARLNAAVDRELREAEIRKHRRQAEKFLRDSELRFSLFMDNYPGLVFIQEAKGDIIYVNKRFKESFPERNWLGQHIRENVSLDWADLLTLGDTQALAGDIVRAVGEVSEAEQSQWFEMVKFHIPREGLPPLIGVQALDVTERMRAENDVLQTKRDLEKAYEETLEGWARALELHERETLGHSRRVVDLTIQLARELNISPEEQVHIRRGALLHDIGKLYVSETIINKRGPLNDEEWFIMRQHPRKAYDLLYPIEYLRPAIDIPFRHHEKWNGKGYPDALEGEEIPYAARLFAVVDVYVALCEKRSYSDAWSGPSALEYIRNQAGEHFDPEIVEVFLRLQEQKQGG